MRIYIAADHRGVILKNNIIKHLNDKNILVNEVGIINTENDDYPDFAFAVCQKVLEDDTNLGILLCGNGIGMSIAANKVKGIRAVRAVDELDCYNGKNHNGANVLCVGSNLDEELIKRMIDTFIGTPNPTEKRHIERINKIIKYENGEYNAL